MLTYPIHVEPDGDGWLITCPDLPEVNSDADAREDAPARAALAIEMAIDCRLRDFLDIPRPSEGGERSAPISADLTLKTLLFWRLRERGWTRADLMRALGWHRTQVDRLFDPRNASRLDHYEAAFAALGRRMSVRLEAA